MHDPLGRNTVHCTITSLTLFSKSVKNQKLCCISTMLRSVGFEVRKLLEAVDQLVPALPANTHREVEMAHKVLSKDMSDLVNAMKLVEKYSNTTVESDYRK